MKRFLIGAGIFILVLLAVALIAPSFIDWNNYRDEIAGQIERATGRQVTIGGDVSFAILPSPALSVEELRIANVPGAASVDFVTLKSLDVEVALFPLLGGSIEVERVVLVEPVVDLEILADGQKNWVFAADEGEEGAGGPNVSVNMFHVENGTIIFRDAGQGSVQRFEGLTLDVTAESLSGPYELSGELRLNDRPLALTLTVGDLEAARIPVEAIVEAERDNARGTFSGVGTLGEEGNSLSGVFKIDASNLSAFLGPDGYSGVLGEPFSLEARSSITEQGIALDDLAVALGASKGRGAFSYDLGESSAFRLLLNVPALDLDALGGAASGSGEGTRDDTGGFEIPAGLRGDIELTVGSIAYRGNTIRQARMAASILDGKMTVGALSALLPGGSDVAFSGTLQTISNKPTVGGKLRVGSANLRNLLGWLGVELDNVPADRLTQLSLNTGLTATSDLVRLHEMDLRVDTTAITGGIAYALQERPSFGATLEIDRINLDAYLPQTDSEPLDLEAELAVLGDFDTNLKLSAGRLTYGQTQLKDVRADIELKASALTINNLSSGDMAGAAVGFQGNATGFGGPISWKVSGKANGDRAGGFVDFLDLPFDSEDVTERPLDLTFSSEGSVKSARMALQGTLGTTALSLGGEGQNIDSDALQFSLRVDVRNDSGAALSRQLGFMELAPPGERDRPAALKGTIVGKQGDFETNLGLDIAGGRVTVIGPVRQVADSVQMALAISIKAPSTRTFLQGMGVDFDPAQRDLGPLDISLKINGAPEQFALEGLSARLGPASLTGSGKYDARGARPRIDIAVNAETLNLDLFLPAEETGARMARQPGGERWSRAPSDYSSLRDWDGTLTFKADQFQVSRYRFDALATEISLKDGRLALDRFSGFFFGGQAGATASLDVRATPRLELELSLKGASVAQALLAAADLQTATGTFTLNGRFSAAGDSQHAMISNLSGNGNFKARDGLVRGVDLPRLSEQLLTLVEYDDFIKLARITLDGGETEYESMVATLDISKGVATILDGRAVLESSEASMKATLDLPKWTMDANMVFRLTAPEHKKTPPVGMRLYGDIDSPKQENRVTALGAFLTKKLADRVLQDVFGGEGNGNGLRDLLGGGQQQGAEQGGSNNNGSSPQQGGTPQTKPLDLIFQGIMNEVRKDREQQQ